MITNAYKRANYANRLESASCLERRNSSEIGQQRRFPRIKAKQAHHGNWAIIIIGIILMCICCLVLNSILKKKGEGEWYLYTSSYSERHLHSDIVERYDHSDMMPHIGDKSYRYSKLRKFYDAKLPKNTKRMKDFVHSLHKHEYSPIMKDEMTYDIHNCPFNPPPNYPFAWNIAHVLENWPPDNPSPPKDSLIYQGLCVFDFDTERDKAMNYRMAEVPFIVRDDPEVLRTTERWNQPGYMEQLLRDVKHRTEYSPNNHFMYWNKPKKLKDLSRDWKPPTKMLRMPYQEWLSHANITDESKLGPDMEHWYYRLIGCGKMDDGKCDRASSEYLFDELAFFQPRIDNNLYMTEPKQQKGIHCRFGMKGVIAENHFDGARNMIALMGGERRYILSHPDQCENLSLFPRDHPSGRHSAVDWSNPDWDKFPKFRDAEVNEVVLQAGDVLYLPTYWFHYIISLDLNFQCNTRSGMSDDYSASISQCGFKTKR